MQELNRLVRKTSATKFRIITTKETEGNWTWQVQEEAEAGLGTFWKTVLNQAPSEEPVYSAQESVGNANLAYWKNKTEK